MIGAAVPSCPQATLRVRQLCYVSARLDEARQAARSGQSSERPLPVAVPLTERLVRRRTRLALSSLAQHPWTSGAGGDAGPSHSGTISDDAGARTATGAQARRKPTRVAARGSSPGREPAPLPSAAGVAEAGPVRRYGLARRHRASRSGQRQARVVQSFALFTSQLKSNQTTNAHIGAGFIQRRPIHPWLNGAARLPD
jgi:hypothetical protein